MRRQLHLPHRQSRPPAQPRLVHDPDSWEQAMKDELTARRFDGAAVRIHDSGDFFSRSLGVVTLWCDIAPVVVRAPSATVLWGCSSVARCCRSTESRGTRASVGGEDAVWQQVLDGTGRAVGAGPGLPTGSFGSCGSGVTGRSRRLRRTRGPSRCSCAGASAPDGIGRRRPQTTGCSSPG